jgi:hypothetical protein
MSAKLKHYLLHPDGRWYRINDAAYERLWCGPVAALAGRRVAFADLHCRTRADGATEIVEAAFAALPYGPDGHPDGRWHGLPSDGTAVRRGQPWRPNEREFAALLETLSSRSRVVVETPADEDARPVSEHRATGARARWFAFDPDDVLYRVSAMLPAALLSLDVRLPALAERWLAIVKADVAYVADRPGEIVALEGRRWRLDALGLVDLASSSAPDAAWTPSRPQLAKLQEAALGRAFAPLLRPTSHSR